MPALPETPYTLLEQHQLPAASLCALHAGSDSCCKQRQVLHSQQPQNQPVICRQLPSLTALLESMSTPFTPTSLPKASISAHDAGSSSCCKQHQVPALRAATEPASHTAAAAQLDSPAREHLPAQQHCRQQPPHVWLSSRGFWRQQKASAIRLPLLRIEAWCLILSA